MDTFVFIFLCLFLRLAENIGISKVYKNFVNILTNKFTAFELSDILREGMKKLQSRYIIFKKFAK